MKTLNFGFGSSSVGTPGTIPTVLPVITQTLNDGNNFISLGGNYRVINVTIIDSVTFKNVPAWEWAQYVNNQIEVQITGTTYTDALIYIYVIPV